MRRSEIEPSARPSQGPMRSWLVLVLLVSACTPPSEMVRSSAAMPERRLYADEATESGGGEAAVPVEASVPLEEAPEVDLERSGAVAPVEATTVRESLDAMPAATSASGTSAGSTTYVPPPNTGGWVSVEPLPYVPLDPAPLPAGPRHVLLATMEVPPGRSIFPPVSSCQDVLVYVEDGALEAMGTGVGSTDAPATLYAGDAARFGAEGDGRLTNRTGEPARALVIIARARGAGAPLYTAPVDAGLCVRDEAVDPLVGTMRLGSEATTTPLSVSDGRLVVRILLDLDGSAAEHAGLALLEGTPAFGAAPHVHEGSDEVLYVEEGDGVLHLGDETIPVHDGAVLYIPAGVEHDFAPSGSSAFRALQIYAPSGPEQRFRGLAGGR